MEFVDGYSEINFVKRLRKVQVYDVDITTIFNGLENLVIVEKELAQTGSSCSEAVLPRIKKTLGVDKF